ncbi:hypothetical protein COOONC_17154, partial [Cooperia oncophora]
MDTPSRVVFKGTKRSCPSSSPSYPASSLPCLEDAMREVNTSTMVPDCVKNAFNSVIHELIDIRQERDKLRQENLLLRQKLEHSNTSSPITNPDCVESERLRSLVIAGVPELDDSLIRNRLFYDYNIFYTNIRSFPKNCISLDLVAGGRYDLYLFTETWLKKHHSFSSMLNDWIGDYSILRCDRSRRAGGGVAILLRKTINHSVIFSESIPLGYEILVTDIATPEFRFRIILAYRPPSTSSTITEQLAKAISDLAATAIPKLNGIGGMILKNHITRLPKLLFCDAVSMPIYRRIPPGNNYLWTYFHANDHELVKNVSVRSPIGDSDHFSICFEISVCVPHRSIHIFASRPITLSCDYRLLPNFTFYAIYCPIESFESRGFHQYSGTKKYNMFLSILNHSIDIFVPWVYVYPTKPNLPYYLQNMLDHKECLLRYAKLSGDWNEFNTFSKKFTERSKNAQRFYKFMRSRLRKESQFSDLKYEGELLLNDDDKANAFAKEFSKTFQQDDSQLPSYSHTVPSTMQTFPHFDPRDIYNLLMRWPCSFSITPDHIPFVFIRKIAHAISFPLAYIFNQSI